MKIDDRFTLASLDQWAQGSSPWRCTRLTKSELFPIGEGFGFFVFYGRKISIDCTGVEDALDVTMAQQTELDYLIYNDPLDYADLILNGDPKEYLKNVSGSRTLKD